jgi:16S rRNA processing protein RimM
VPRVAGSRRRGPGRPAALAPSPDAGAAPHPDLLVVGRVGKPQGVKGEVTVQVRTDDPDSRFAPGSVLVTEPPERGPLTVERRRWQNGTLVVGFAGIGDRDAAEGLRNTTLQIDARTLPPSEDPDEFHDSELVGLVAELVDGTAVGSIAEVLHLPGGDVLVVRSPEREVLVPFVRDMVPVVDVPGGRVVLTPPQGLMDLA